MTKTPNVCPECSGDFKGKGWEGIDAHWKAEHGHLMSYEEAWPLIAAGAYRPQRKTREDLNQAAARIIREATERD